MRRYRRFLPCIPALLALCLAGNAQAEKLRFLSGTGFFVSLHGHVITNDHVVQNCTNLYVKNGGDPVPATLIANNKEKDLALLKASVVTNAIAYLRSPESELKEGERLAIIGYPHTARRQGELTSSQAVLKKDSGLLGEEEFIQFTDSVAQGNSGGPVLDTSGNTVGVVMAKAKLYFENPQTGKREYHDNSDLAISLSVLRDFLQSNGVHYVNRRSNGDMALHRLTNIAKRFTVHVLCQQQ